MHSNRLEHLAVTLIHAAFDSFQVQFEAITRRAKWRFERRDWQGAQHDATDRLALYKSHVDQVVSAMRSVLGDRVVDTSVWSRAKEGYAESVDGREDSELAETFLNSVTRRIFATVGVDPEIEFVAAGDRAPGQTSPAVFPPIHRTYRCNGATPALVQTILGDFPWSVGYENLARDSALVAAAIDENLRVTPGSPEIDAVDVLTSVFYRNKGAYIVGRIQPRGVGACPIPLILPLLNERNGVVVDAVLMTSDEANIVFGFTRSYFRVDAPRPRALVAFLNSIMPLKRVDEIYTAIGFNKHGKTELYRSLLEHLATPDARFEVAEGDEGLVMAVFTLPSFNVVFKIIKDTFGHTKTTIRKAVMAKYQLVFVHDRAGRLADAQEFEHLAFSRRCFSDSLLRHLREVASGNVRVEDDHVVVRHLYTERRVTPLNLFLQDAAAEAARDAIVDYGNAIKELAAANIFTGDMLLKNFGITRHGRVVFYDYDELCLLTDCNFRELPKPTDIIEELSAEPWFYVGEHDVFPEEFGAFMLPSGHLRDAFLDAHADLLTLAFWREMYERQQAGEIVDIFPYRQSRRLRR